MRPDEYLQESLSSPMAVHYPYASPEQRISEFLMVSARYFGLSSEHIDPYLTKTNQEPR